MVRYQVIEMQLADLDIEGEENEELEFADRVEENRNKYEMCLAGQYLTGKNINGRAMKTKMADVWKPTMGINIKELESGVYLFQFYHKEDMQWVLNGGRNVSGGCNTSGNRTSQCSIVAFKHLDSYTRLAYWVHV